MKTVTGFRDFQLLKNPEISAKDIFFPNRILLTCIMAILATF
jgi:hypothetical protein